MICTECGKVIEFFSPEIEALQDAMADTFQFRPTHHSLRILGVCSECQQKESDIHATASGAQPRIRVMAGKNR
jgi:Fur family transcriptional regulator, ferric uptake regulator